MIAPVPVHCFSITFGSETCFGHSHCFCLKRFRLMTLKMILKKRGVTSVHSQVFMTLRIIAKPILTLDN